MTVPLSLSEIISLSVNDLFIDLRLLCVFILLVINLLIVVALEGLLDVITSEAGGSPLCLSPRLVSLMGFLQIKGSCLPSEKFLCSVSKRRISLAPIF